MISSLVCVKILVVISFCEKIITFFIFVEDSKNASRTFSDSVSTLQAALDEAERTLNQRTAAALPRDLDSLEHMVIDHKDFETRLQVMGLSL